jgi:hypothetical protein
MIHPPPSALSTATIVPPKGISSNHYNGTYHQQVPASTSADDRKRGGQESPQVPSQAPTAPQLGGVARSITSCSSPSPSPCARGSGGAGVGVERRRRAVASSVRSTTLPSSLSLAPSSDAECESDTEPSPPPATRRKRCSSVTRREAMASGAGEGRKRRGFLGAGGRDAGSSSWRR